MQAALYSWCILAGCTAGTASLHAQSQASLTSRSTCRAKVTACTEAWLGTCGQAQQRSSLPSAAADPLSELLGVARATAVSAAAAAGAAAAAAPTAGPTARAPAPSAMGSVTALASDAAHVVRSAGAFAHEAAGSLHAGKVTARSPAPSRGDAGSAITLSGVLS